MTLGPRVMIYICFSLGIFPWNLGLGISNLDFGLACLLYTGILEKMHGFIPI